jgi:uncharacterized membrane protein YgcG
MVPRRTGFVTDAADILSPDVESEISDLCYQAKKTARCEVLVVTAFAANRKSAQAYAEELLTLMQPTPKRRDNTVLLLVTTGTDEALTQPREAGVAAGFGLQGVIPDSEQARIAASVNEQLRTVSLAEAVRTGARMMIERVAPGALSVSPATVPARQDLSAVFFALATVVVLGVAGLLVIGLLFAAGRHCRECKGRMALISESIIARSTGGERSLCERLWECKRCGSQKLEKLLKWPEDEAVSAEESLNWLGMPKRVKTASVTFGGGSSSGAGAGADW